MQILWSGPHRRNKLTATISREGSGMLADPVRIEIDAHTGKLIYSSLSVVPMLTANYPFC